MSNCILCGHESEHFLRTEGYEVYKCVNAECGLYYSDPMALPDDAESYFSAAYRGEVDTPGMRDIGIRVSLMRTRRRFRPEDYFRGAQLDALRWLRKNAPEGGTVVDLGCGQGDFLRALRREGFHAVGIDPSIDVVEALRGDGYEVHQGTWEDIPPDCPVPFAVTSHFVVHHLMAPVEAVRSVQARFPRAPLLVTEGNISYQSRLSPDFLPPRALTLWKEGALRLLLSKAGYDVVIRGSARRTNEFGVLSPDAATSLYQAIDSWLPADKLFSLWAASKKYVLWPKSMSDRVTGRPPATLLAVGTPKRHGQSV